MEHEKVERTVQGKDRVQSFDVICRMNDSNTEQRVVLDLSNLRLLYEHEQVPSSDRTIPSKIRLPCSVCWVETDRVVGILALGSS